MSWVEYTGNLEGILMGASCILAGYLGAHSPVGHSVVQKLLLEPHLHLDGGRFLGAHRAMTRSWRRAHGIGSSRHDGGDTWLDFGSTWQHLAGLKGAWKITWAVGDLDGWIILGPGNSVRDRARHVSQTRATFGPIRSREFGKYGGNGDWPFCDQSPRVNRPSHHKLSLSKLLAS